ncbi:bifunctional diguanylate cyclase/phosphodiesterase [Noviherbaspirillum sp. UKPF54]|uniref:putative bifunctional diguanylate cyclase/phosphodiesterase n=1 Tax=Noviherbaspirillum sp. UKPF54 TaxID=2601898 RepID=UPI0011B19E32|nr:EAL domain-containing protein [Noviherbaspirillum sp. UKPF54]QDZ27853.1 EAL domain-containing protein [Noviherbaspirillum sp. UKPF54]
MEKIKLAPVKRDRHGYARLHAILDSLNEGVLMYALDGQVIEANQAALDFLSATTKEEIKLTKAGLDATFEVSTLDAEPVPVEDWPVWRVMHGEEVADIVLWVRNKRTGRQWISSHSGRPLRFLGTNETFAVLSIRDITKSKTAELQVQAMETRLKSAFDSFIDQVIIVDHQLKPTYLNSAARRAGMPIAAGGENVFWHAAARDALTGAKPVTTEVQHITDSGVRDYTVSATPLFNAASAIDEVVVFAHDSTERNHAQESLRKAALHDPLTGLPNRALLYECAKHLFGEARRSCQQVAVLFIDLDRFKSVNDIYGHEVGDKLLRELAARIQSRMRGEDVITRIGGDEFVILLPQVDERRLPHTVAADLIHLIGKPVNVDGIELTVEACIGISLFPSDGETLNELLRRADAAMYAAKDSGRNSYRFYTDDLASQSITHSRIEHELRRAIGKGELSMAYQPIVEISSGKVLCAEALIRWENGRVGPDVFVPIAEMSGLVSRMTDWVLDEIAREQHRWRQQGLPLIPISVNVSPVQFKLRSFVDDIERRLREKQVPADALQIELTETAVMDNVDHAIRTIQRLRELGVKVALDDFGKGYSSLSYLSHLPIDKIKIDKEFILGFDQNASNRAITDAIIALGTALQLEVVAEGIESREALAYVREQGCRQAQGFYLCKPVSGKMFATLFAQGTVSGFNLDP